MTMRAAIYARVSSHAQRDRDTIENQLRVLPSYVASQGWELVETYIDDGKSAKTGALDRRDGFARLQRDAIARRFDVVVVADIDRLTRTASNEERAAIIGPFQTAGVQIATPGSGMQDLRTLMGEFYVTMHALFAAEENRKRSERIRAGKITRAKQGRKGTGRTPFGWTFDLATGLWGVDPVRAPILVEIYERLANAESSLEIADDFDRRGLQAPGTRGWNRHRVWEVAKLRHAVGEYTASGVTFAIPALIDRELWERAQSALAKGRMAKLHKTWHVYLLDKISTCAKCGGMMRVRSAMSAGAQTRRPNAPQQPAVYVCVNRILRKRSATPCDAPLAKVVETDARAWAALVRELEDPELLNAIALERDSRAGDARDWTDDLAGYKKHLARLDAVETALLARFRRNAISEKGMDVELAALGRERAAVNAQVAAASRAKATIASSQERLAAGATMLGRIREKLVAATPEARRAVFRLMVDRVVFRDGRAIIDLVIPKLSADVAVTGSFYSDPHSYERGEVLRIRAVA